MPIPDARNPGHGDGIKPVKKVTKVTGGPRNRKVETSYEDVDASSDSGKKYTGRAAEVAAIIAAGKNLGKTSADRNKAIEKLVSGSGLDAQDMKDLVALKLARSKVNAGKGTTKDIIKAGTGGRPTEGAGGKGGASGAGSKITKTPGSSSDPYLDQLAKALEGMFGNQLDFKLPDQKTLERMSKEAANREFDPKIASVRSEMSAASKRGGQASKDVGDLYDQLVNQYSQEEKKSIKAYKGAKKSEKKRTKDLRNTITKDYTNRIKEQTKLYKQLGIEAAVPSAMSGQFGDQASQLAQAEQGGATEQAALNMEDLANRDYLASGRVSSRSEGVEQQADIIGQLQDYLRKQGNQVSELEGSKASMYNQAMMKLTENAAASGLKAQELAMGQQNNMWKSLMDLANYKRGLASDAVNNNMSQAELELKLRQHMDQLGVDNAKLKLDATKAGQQNYKSGLLGASQYLNDQRLTGQFQSSLDAATKYAPSAQARSYYGTGDKAANSPEQMASIIRDNALNQGRTPAEATKLYQAALIYFGKGQG